MKPKAEDMQLRVDQVTKVFMRLQNARMQAVGKFLEDEKTLHDVKARSNQANEKMRRVTQYRQQIVRIKKQQNEDKSIYKLKQNERLIMWNS